MQVSLKFKIICLKCGSDDVDIFADIIYCKSCQNREHKHYLMGCEGSMTD